MNKIDLQVHSTASDGKHAPIEVARMAREHGLETISLTDHDSVDGMEEILSAGRELGVKIIPGIEISVEEHDAHILGYGIDYKNQDLLMCLDKFRQDRMEGAKQMVANLQKQGLAVEWTDVLKEVTGRVVARPHIARAALGRPENAGKLGDIKTVHDFIEKYLLDSGPNFVRRAHISAKDAIDLIKKTGGVAVWSHPAIGFQEDHDGLEKFLDELIEWGLRGVEVFTSAHAEDDVEFIQNLAIGRKLLMTAGSDFHEAKQYPRDERGLHSAEFPGDFPTYGFVADNLVIRLEETISAVNK